MKNNNTPSLKNSKIVIDYQKITFLTKYFNFANIFLKKLDKVLSKPMYINKYIIK